MTAIDTRIAALDVTLFDAVRSQSTVGDKRSWLALQAATRAVKTSYVYLEIGSYLGGSIQPHLLDPACHRIYSIDKRPLEQPDDRGEVYSYRDSTAGRMLDNLRQLDAHQVSKVVSLVCDAADVDRAGIVPAPDLCLIDGEHTTTAVLSDFRFCASVAAADAIICFHDANVVHAALEEIVDRLRQQKRAFTALKMEGLTFAIALGAAAAVREPILRGIATDGHRFLREMNARRRRQRVGWLMPEFVKRAVRSARISSRVSPTHGSQ